MYEIALIAVALMAITNVLCFVILTDLIKEMREWLKDIYYVTFRRKTILEIAKRVEQEAKALYPCDCDKEEENDSDN